MIEENNGTFRKYECRAQPLFTGSRRHPPGTRASAAGPGESGRRIEPARLLHLNLRGALYLAQTRPGNDVQAAEGPRKGDRRNRPRADGGTKSAPAAGRR